MRGSAEILYDYPRYWQHTRTPATKRITCLTELECALDACTTADARCRCILALSVTCSCLLVGDARSTGHHVHGQGAHGQVVSLYCSSEFPHVLVAPFSVHLYRVPFSNGGWGRWGNGRRGMWLEPTLDSSNWFELTVMVL